MFSRRLQRASSRRVLTIHSGLKTDLLDHGQDVQLHNIICQGKDLGPFHATALIANCTLGHLEHGSRQLWHTWLSRNSWHR